MKKILKEKNLILFELEHLYFRGISNIEVKTPKVMLLVEIKILLAK
jgi:hypothetical protein